MLVIKNSKSLINPENLKLKILLYGMNGTGKTTFLSTVPNIGIGASETGHGRGLLGIAGTGVDFVEINGYDDFESFCNLTVFRDKDAVGLDSLSDVVKTHVKAKALSFPNTRGDTQRRASGIPEMQDWGVIGELGRKLLRKLIDQDKHIIVTAALRVDKPDENNPGGETIVGPDLAGQLFLGSTAMFDLVLCTRTRSVLDNPKDAKSRRTEYFYLTNSPGNGIIAKNRIGAMGGKSFLPQEVIFNPVQGEGDFTWLLNKAKEGYAKFLAEKSA